MKLVNADPEALKQKSNRRLIFPSTGFLTFLPILLVLFFVAITAAIAVTLSSRSKDQWKQEEHKSDIANTPPIQMAIDANFPDPSLWCGNGMWYAYGTKNAAGILDMPDNTTVHDYGTANVQLATSTDFVHWDQNPANAPLPVTGARVAQGSANSTPSLSRAQVWAPSIIQRHTDKKYVLYYSANSNGPMNRYHVPPLCIGAAVCDTHSPASPFHPVDEPLTCPL